MTRAATGPGDQRGAALLIVLMMVATLSVVALGLTQTMSRSIQRAGAAQNRDQAFWALLGAERAAITYLVLQDQLRPGIDTPDERWLAEPVTLPIGDILLRGSFRDRSACFNVNSFVTTKGVPVAAGPQAGGQGEGERRYATDETAVTRFGLLITAMEGNARAAQALGFAAADFIDSDSDPNLGGAEDNQYSLGEMPYLSARTLLADPSELRAVYGWDADTYRRLAPTLCALPETTDPAVLNVNTLTEEDVPLLVAASDRAISPELGLRLIETRPPDGWENPASFLSSPLLRDLEPPLPNDFPRNIAVKASLVEFSTEALYDGGSYAMRSLLVSTGENEWRVVRRRFDRAE